MPGGGISGGPSGQDYGDQLKDTAHALQNLLSLLKESQYVGRIVTISSMAAYMGFTGVLPYDMTKSGVLGLTRGLAEEWEK